MSVWVQCRMIPGFNSHDSNLWLRQLTARSTSLSSLMDQVSDKAQARGLTLEILEEMLNTC